MLDQNTRRFWQSVNVGRADECWLWKKATFQSGYGAFRVNGETLRAHRVAYQLSYGDIEPSLVVMHLCNNKACCNPGHLRLGSQAENLAQAGREGRMSRTSPKIPQSKISAILELGRTQSLRAVSRAVGVDHKTVSRILNINGV